MARKFRFTHRKRNPASVQHINQNLVPDMSAQRQRAFLDRAQGWAVTAKSYVAVKILGAGSYGLAVLFQKAGGKRKNRIIPNTDNEDLPKKFVVKQGTDGSFERDAKFLLRIEDAGFLSGSGSKHIVRIYRSVEKEGGSGTHAIFDRHPFTAAGVYAPNQEVYRIYMEYCEGGDLDSKIRKRINGDNYEYPSEELTWRVFGCLTKAMMMLGDGSEDVLDDGALSWYGGREIVHLDMNPANVLVGVHDDNDHQRLPIVKLCDFGLAMEVPPLASRNQNWRLHTDWRGTDGWIAPEQLYDNNGADFPLDTRINMWGIGIVMFNLMTGDSFQHLIPQLGPGGGPLPPLIRQSTFATRSTTHPLWTNAHFEAFGAELLDPPFLYSKHLIQLVHRCLALDPDDRPNAPQLWNIIDATLTDYDVVHGANAARFEFERDVPNVLPRGRTRTTPAAAVLPAHTMQQADTGSLPYMAIVGYNVLTNPDAHFTARIDAARRALPTARTRAQTKAAEATYKILKKQGLAKLLLKSGKDRVLFQMKPKTVLDRANWPWQAM